MVAMVRMADLVTEKDFREQVVAIARLHGWLVYWTWNSKNSPKGFPDLVMVRRERLVFAELKTTAGKVSSSQQSWLDALGALHRPAEAHVWRPDDWMEIEECLA
jgi:hypothetical protein